MSKKDPRPPMTRVEILIIGGAPEPGDVTFPQTIMTAFPDMTNEQWEKLGKHLVEQAHREDNKINVDHFGDEQ